MLFFKRVNSRLKDLKERTEFDIITIDYSLNEHFLAVYIFRYASVLSNDPYTTQTVHAFQKRLSIPLIHLSETRERTL